ncbi:hypothetical protein ACQZV8_08775 [Magnetococcales bacterium HHB-1]
MPKKAKVFATASAKGSSGSSGSKAKNIHIKMRAAQGGQNSTTVPLKTSISMGSAGQLQFKNDGGKIAIDARDAAAGDSITIEFS